MVADVQRWITVKGKRIPVGAKRPKAAGDSDEARQLRSLLSRYEAHKASGEHVGQLSATFHRELRGAWHHYFAQHPGGEAESYGAFIEAYNAAEQYLKDLRQWEGDQIEEATHGAQKAKDFVALQERLDREELRDALAAREE
jgi:hypothetical protein